MKDSFAQRYWKEFELLALKYIQEQYKDISAKCIHTPYSNDNGYDGSLSLVLTKDNAPFVHEVINLIEAKLRTNSNINIHDFAASIIAAYNFSAHILYVVSNTNFTVETKKITKVFSDKVNLQIILIDGKYLLNWLKNNTFQKNNQFHKDLILSIETNIAHANKRSIFLASESTSPKLLPEIFSETIYAQPKKIFGVYTKSIKKEISELLEKIDLNKRVIILSGAMGTGKSTLISNIAYELQKKKFLFNIFNGGNEEGISIRSVYFWVLKSLWGIDPLTLYSGENIYEFIDFICFTTKTAVDANVKKAIREIFNAKKDSYMAKSDLYVAYLLRYLDEILKDKQGKNRSILAFKNLHQLDSQVLEFIIPLIQHLIKNNVGIIIELGSFENLRIYDEQWKRCYNILYQFKQHGRLYELKDFEKQEALDYLSENLHGLTHKYYEYILNQIGLKPVFLKYAIEWLVLNKVVIFDADVHYYTVAKPDAFFSGITPNQNLKIIEDIIRYYQENTQQYGDNIIILFELMILMEGSLKISLIEHLCHYDNSPYIMQLLINTGLFVRIGNCINISHELVLNALKNTSLSIFHFTAAEILYKNIELLEDKEIICLKKIDLLEVLGRWDDLYKNAQQIAKNFMENGQYEKSIKYFTLCRTHYNKLKYQNHSNLLIILYYELFAYHKIGMGAQQKILFLNYQEHLQIERVKMKKEPPIFLCAMEKMYHARLSISEKKYDSACKMLEYARQNFKKIPEELYVEICFVFALIEKKYISLNSAVNFLKEQKKLLPRSIELDIHYQSHEAAKYLNIAPNKALIFYENIVKYSGKSKRNNKSIGHAYVDILTCYILSENWIAFEKKYPEVLEYVQTNAQYAEEGRIYNLDGLLFWIKNELNNSEKYFRDAQFYLGIAHNRYTDIFVKINFVGLLIERRKYKEAILELEVAYRLLRKTYDAIFRQIEKTKDYKHNREYAALLILTTYATRLGKLDIVKNVITEIPIKDLVRHIKQMEQEIYPKEVFSDTCIIHSNRVTLTR